MFKNKILTDETIRKMNNYLRATNYLSVAQIYLIDNPLLRESLKREHIKPNLVGHWGSAPGQNFVYVHLNRIIKKHKLNMLYISGPGHGGQALFANTYLEGSYTEIYPNITEDEEGLRRLCKQFSFPGGVSSHVAPECPGSINEGGELGYSLSHAYGAVLDNPDLIATCVVGDGEAETGPLAGSWWASKFINPKKDGTVLPILHMNGYKIANPTIFDRIPRKELKQYFEGMGYIPYLVEGSTIAIHEKMAKALEQCISDIKKIKRSANLENIKWPMIILRTPKGWTGPKEVDGLPNTDTFRSHQVPVLIKDENIESITHLENWLKSYHPHELFDEQGKLIPELKELAPPLELCMGLNKHTNGGLLLKELKVPDFREFCIDIESPGAIQDSDMTILGNYVREVIRLNEDNFLVFGPDEAKSNKLGSAFEVTNRKWLAEIKPNDENQAPVGRVIDGLLNEHLCQGWLEGYLLTGRHGFFHSYEAFIRIVDSMASQHAKWLKVANELPWRNSISSLNYILTSHVWQQDHNGYTHQNPGFLNHLVTKKADIVRMYLPPDANCLLSCFDHVIKTKNYINVIVASKHMRPQWLSAEDAIKHCTKGIGIWEFASTYTSLEPDIVMACCGETPTLETIAAVSILNEFLPKLKIRVVNVVDLMRLQSDDQHPHGMTHEDYNTIFTKDKPIIFNFHGYPDLIHQLSYKRENKNLHVRGYIEEGTITTTFDMRVQNKIDRFNLVLAALKYLPNIENKTEIYEWCQNKLIEHKNYIKEYGTDMPMIREWKWNGLKNK